MSIQDQVAAAADIELSDIVDVPEWRVKLQFGQMSLDAGQRWLRRRREADGDENETAILLAELVATTAVDPETGEPAFGEGAVAMLRRKNGEVVSRLANEAMRLNGMLGEAVDEGKDGSSPIPSSTPPTTSPSD